MPSGKDAMIKFREKLLKFDVFLRCKLYFFFITKKRDATRTDPEKIYESNSNERFFCEEAMRINTSKTVDERRLGIRETEYESFLCRNA